MIKHISSVSESHRGIPGYYIIIRNNITKQILPYYHPYPFNEFWLTEGNWCCDCNRSMDFQRAKGIPEDDIIPAECNRENAIYDILWVVLRDGTVVFLDKE